MDFLRTSALLLIAIFSVAQVLAVEIKESESDGIKLILGSAKMPKTLGKMVPFEVQFTDPLKNGEELTVLTDSVHLAYLIKPKEEFTLNRFKGRVRMNEGALKVVVKRVSGKTIEIKQSIAINEQYSIPKSGKATKKYRIRGKGNKIEFIHSNTMALENFVKQMDVIIPGGGLSISMSPYSSGVAYYLIEGNPALDNANIEIQLANTPYQLSE